MSGNKVTVMKILATLAIASVFFISTQDLQAGWRHRQSSSTSTPQTGYIPGGYYGAAYGTGWGAIQRNGYNTHYPGYGMYTGSGYAGYTYGYSPYTNYHLFGK